MAEADYQTWMQKHKAEIAKIEADLEAIKLATRTQPDTQAVKEQRTRDVSDTSTGGKKGSLFRSLAGRLCGRGVPQVAQ